MENCAFIDVFTTMNDLYGSKNCPIQFRCEVSSWEEMMSGLNAKAKQINMIPDEKILGNGTAFHGFTNSSIEIMSLDPDRFGKWMSLYEGLSKIHFIMSWFSDNGVYVIGYGLKEYVLKVLNEHFERILKKEPIKFDEGRIIDVESLSKLFVDVNDCGNYCKNSVLANLKKDVVDYFTSKRTIKNEIAKTRVILDELICRGNLNTNWHMGSFKEISDFLSSPHPVEYFRVGKYKGMKIEDAFMKDRQYFSWIMKNSRFFENDRNLLLKVESLLNSEDR